MILKIYYSHQPDIHKKKIPRIMVSKFKLKQSREYKFLNNKLTLEIEIVLILSEKY